MPRLNLEHQRKRARALPKAARAELPRPLFRDTLAHALAHGYALRETPAVPRVFFTWLGAKEKR